MPDYLIYHPMRTSALLGRHRVHFDHPSGNQDPYIWNRRFLHSYCHITQLRPLEPGDMVFWVSSTNFRTLPDLLCDLVFVVQDCIYWPSRNSVTRSGPVAAKDNIFAYRDHYRWVNQHPFKKRRRYTLKAHPTESFQPQGPNGTLLDIRPLLLGLGLSQVQLLGLHASRGSRPLHLPTRQATALYQKVSALASKKLTGRQLAHLRARTHNLASKWP